MPIWLIGLSQRGGSVVYRVRSRSYTTSLGTQLGIFPNGNHFQEETQTQPSTTAHTSTIR
jgi:hypothetical protein